MRFGAASGIGLCGFLGMTALLVSGCATGGVNGTDNGGDDASTDGTNVDGSLDGTTPDGSGSDGDETGGDSSPDAIPDIFLGDATVLDLLDVCVLGTGGPKGPCDSA